MSDLETPENLLVTKRTEEISPQHYGGPIFDEFAPAKESRGDVQPAEPFQPVETTIAEVPTSHGKIRWWDLFFVPLNACLGWFFLFGLVGGVLYLATGDGSDLDAFAGAASPNFYFDQISTASFCLILLLATRRVLRKRRGRGSFASYFRPVGGK